MTTVNINHGKTGGKSQISITAAGKSEKRNVKFIHISIFIFVLLTRAHC